MAIVYPQTDEYIQHLPLHQGIDIPHCRVVSSDTSDRCNDEIDSFCNACPHCADSCGNPNCIKCKNKCLQHPTENQFLFGASPTEKYYTMCQVRRHDNEDSAWLLIGDTIYDATSYIAKHPGGRMSILKKSGGKVDCSIDFEFHSKGARRLWKKFKIGKLCACPGKRENFGTDDPCTIS